MGKFFQLLFGDTSRPKRRFGTELYYPDKMSVEEFVEEVSNPEALRSFVANMRHLQERGYQKEKYYVETWMDEFTRWMEMEF